MLVIGRGRKRATLTVTQLLTQLDNNLSLDKDRCREAPGRLLFLSLSLTRERSRGAALARFCKSRDARVRVVGRTSSSRPSLTMSRNSRQEFWW
jgi:hypothetical protein